MDSLQRVAVGFAVVAAAAWAMVAYSVAETIQTPAETPSQTVPEATDPDPGISGSSTEPLGDRLGRSRGMLRPPGGIDPGLTRSPPQDGDKMPVIEPPGTHDDRSAINPEK